MKVPVNRMGELPHSKVVVFIHGGHIFIYEYYSHGMMEKVIRRVDEDGGLVVRELCRSMCG